jgi:hypothetical protein
MAGPEWRRLERGARAAAGAPARNTAPATSGRYRGRRGCAPLQDEPSARGVAMPAEDGGEFRRSDEFRRSRHSAPGATSTAEPGRGPGSAPFRTLSRREHRRAARACAHTCTQTFAASARTLLPLSRRPWRGRVVVRSAAAWWTLVVWLLLAMASATFAHILPQCGNQTRSAGDDACLCPAGPRANA